MPSYGDWDGRKLPAFYAAEAENQSWYSDDEVAEFVESARCASSVEAVLIHTLRQIAAACARRPQLTRRLIRTPVKCTVLMPFANPGPADLFHYAAYVAEGYPASRLPPEGKAWLEELPKHEALVKEVFDDVIAKWDEEMMSG